MRIRSLKPEFWPHRMQRRLNEPSALLALALLSLADDEGRFEADPGLITSQLFPQRPLSQPVDECLDQLVLVGWITLYEAELNGERVRLGQILGFRDTRTPAGQVINRPSPSLFPADSRSAPGALPEPASEAAVSAPGGLIRACTGEWKGMEGNGKEGKGLVPSSADPAGNGNFPEATVPSDAEVLRFAADWAGDLARGIPPVIPEPWTLRWLDWRRETWKSAWPPNWQESLLRRFRADWKEKRPDAVGAVPRGTPKRLEEQRAALTDAIQHEPAKAKREQLRQQLAALPGGNEP